MRSTAAGARALKSDEAMTRRDFLRTLGTGAAALAAQGCGYRPVAAPSQAPNILVVLTDDQRYDALGCAGNPIIRTPAMDGLAAEGVRFINAFASTPICAAGRASLFTGLYERAHGYTFTKPPLSAAVMELSYPALLKAAGYHTGFVGKFGVAVEPGVTDLLFDRFQPTSYPYFKPAGGRRRHLTEIHGDMATAFLRERPRDRPFCLSLSFWAPHAEDDSPQQYFWPESCDGLYRDVTIPPPPTSDPGFHAALPGFLKQSLNRTRWFWRFDTPEKYQKMVKGYYRMISGVDEVLGRIREELDRQDAASDTVIVFTSDNGYFLGERGFAGKWLMHEPSIRVPLIVHDPRLPASRRGSVVNEAALNVDLAPTLLDLAAVPIPEGMQGCSLVAAWQGTAGTGRVEVFCEHLWDHPQIPRTEGFRSGGWKYIRYLQHPEYEELYDLTSDPHESRNLARDPVESGVLRRMRSRCRGMAVRAARRGERM